MLRALFEPLLSGVTSPGPIAPGLLRIYLPPLWGQWAGSVTDGTRTPEATGPIAGFRPLRLLA